MSELSIGEVARRAGMRASAIRYYEQAGLLPVPCRTSGQRRYDPEVLDRLALIRFAQQAGFTIAEIRTLIEGFEQQTPMSLRWKTLVPDKLAEAQALMDRARQMQDLLQRAMDCRCVSLDECASAIHGCAQSHHEASLV